jgi:hypothetical protein
VTELGVLLVASVMIFAVMALAPILLTLVAIVVGFFGVVLSELFWKHDR